MRRFIYLALMILLPLGFVSCNHDDDTEYYYCANSTGAVEYNSTNIGPEAERFVVQWLDKIGIALSQCYLTRVTEADAFRRYSIGVTNLEILQNEFNQAVEENKNTLKNLEFSYVVSVFYAKESDPNNHIKERSFSFKKSSFLLPVE